MTNLEYLQVRNHIVTSFKSYKRALSLILVFMAITGVLGTCLLSSLDEKTFPGIGPLSWRIIVFGIASFLIVFTLYWSENDREQKKTELLKKLYWDYHRKKNETVEDILREYDDLFTDPWPPYDSGGSGTED